MALERIRHLIDRCFETFPALMNPALTTETNGLLERIEIGLNDIDVKSSREESISKARYYRTLFIVNNSISLQGWNWEVAAQILYQSRLVLARHTSESPKVKFAYRATGLPDREVDVRIAMGAFESEAPEQRVERSRYLDDCLKDHTSRCSYSTKPLKLHLCILLSDGGSESDWVIERDILESGKKLRYLGASPAEVVIHFVQIGTDRFRGQILLTLRDHINADQALAGIIVCLFYTCPRGDRG